MSERILKSFLFFCIIAMANGQTKQDLQTQNIAIKKQIANINNNLVKTQKEAKLSIAYLNGVNKKIVLREKIYNNTQKEKRIIENEIYLKQLEINRQKKELGILRKNYADVLVKAYKNKGVQNKVTFILSSKNIGEALRRVEYLRVYSDFQTKKANEIIGVAKKLKATMVSRQKSMKDKDILLVSQQKDLTSIEEDRKQKEQLFESFKQNQVHLTKELRQKQAESKVLEKKIRDIIAEEIRIAKLKEEAERKERLEKERLAKIAAEKEKARIEAENRARIAEAAEAKRRAEAEAKRLKEIADKKAAEELERTKQAELADAKKMDDERKANNARKAEEKRLLAAKEAALAAEKAKAAEAKAVEARAAQVEVNKQNKAAQAEAEKRSMNAFGVGSNSVANFASNRGSLIMPANGTVTHRFGRQPHPVLKNIVEENNGIKIAVPQGTVAKCVFAGTVSRVFLDGGTKTVIVRHGGYFSIYSNLSNILVSQNQTVTAGTPIGAIASDFDGSYTLDFQIWNGSTPIDPIPWLR